MPVEQGRVSQVVAASEQLLLYSKLELKRRCKLLEVDATVASDCRLLIRELQTESLPFIHPRESGSCTTTHSLKIRNISVPRKSAVHTSTIVRTSDDATTLLRTSYMLETTVFAAQFNHSIAWLHGTLSYQCIQLLLLMFSD